MIVKFKNFPNSKENFKYWEAELYKSMAAVGVTCKRVYRPRWKREIRYGLSLEDRYILTNSKQREVITNGYSEEKDDC